MFTGMIHEVKKSASIWGQSTHKNNLYEIKYRCVCVCTWVYVGEYVFVYFKGLKEVQPKVCGICFCKLVSASIFLYILMSFLNFLK